jgi:OFA family oxalate/formate antiporter-like MFS transporter
MRGFTTGLVFLGGGAGSLIGGVVGPLLIVGIGVYSAFASLGIILGFLVVVSGSTLRNPPAGWQPPGWTPSRPPQDYAPSEVLRSRQFYLLWFIYLFWIAPGLMVISQAVPFAQEMGGLTPVVAGAALTVMAIFNGLGRPGFGWISDKIGRNQAATVAQVVQIVSLLLVLPNARSFAMFTIGISLIGFAQGGASVLVPVCIADYFGTRDFGINYVLFSTVWGAASLFGPIWALGRATTGSWMGAFLASAFLSAAAAVLAFITKVPPRRGA